MEASQPETKHPMDSKVWASFRHSFSQVQFLLDHNRLLIKEINQNHESKIPESLTRNVMLIRELNGNINKVVDLYAKLSSDFVKSFESRADGNSAVQSSAKPVESNSGTGGPNGSLFKPPLVSSQGHKNMRTT